MIRTLVFRLRALLTGHRFERDMADEMHAHLEQTAALMVARGMTPVDAALAARREFGNVGMIQEAARDEGRVGIWAEHVRRDVVHALRSLRRTPGFTMVVLATLGLGIGSVTTIFSIVSGMLFRPPPYPDANRIFALTEQRRGLGGFSSVSEAAIAEIRRASRSFGRLAVFEHFYGSGASLTTGGDPIVVDVQRIDSAVFGMLGARPERGRLFAADEFREDASVVVISDSLWRGRFNGDEHLIGHPIRLDGRGRIVVGILPPAFRFPIATDVWVPLLERQDSVGQARYSVLGKLRPGVSLGAARAEMAGIGRSLAAADPAHFPPTTRIVVQDGMLEQQSLKETGIVALPFLFAAICVLLVACANIAGLSLVRAAERRREMAIRASVGGSAGRLLAQNLTESAVLGLGGGAIGVLLSVWGVKLVLGLAGEAPDWMTFGVDWRVLTLTFALSLLATITFGLSPAREAIRIDLTKSLKGGGDGTTAGGPHRRGAWRQVVVELGLALMLVISTSALVQQARKEASADLGFSRDKILRVGFRVEPSRYPNGRAAMRFAHDVAAELARSPAVAATAVQGVGFLVTDSATVAVAQARAQTDPGHVDLALNLPSDPQRKFGPVADMISGGGGEPAFLGRLVVSQDYQRAMGLSLAHGRWFDPADNARSAPVAVLSDALTRVLWPSGDAVGKSFRFGTHGTAITVIGVVSDTWTITVDHPRQAEPAVYLIDTQAIGWYPSVLVRAVGDATPLMKLVAPAIHAVDPEQPVERPQLLEDHEDADIKEFLRPISTLIGAFSFIALGLALIGIYGITAYGVTQRTREIGIRLALGAQTADVIGAVMGDGLRFIGAGLVLGLLFALGSSRIMQSFLWGVSWFDPVTTAMVLAGFGAVALLACYVPSRRAARVDPVVALRAE